MRHPEDEQLLRYADGELPARAAGEIRAHLEACWQCRAALEELQDTVGQCVGYRKNVLQRHLPPPPAPWMDIHGRFAEIDAALEQAGFMDRVARVLAWPMQNAKKWAPVAVAVMIVWGLFYRYRLTPSVQAAELLRKAMVASDARTARPHRIQIRTREQRFTRLAGSEQKLAVSTAGTDTLNSLKTLFVAAKYDWDDPLSAKSFQAWRNQLRDKQDQVVQEPDSYRIRTETESGELIEASLKLRSQDLQPVEGRFEFRNREWVEISEIAEEAPPADTIRAADEREPETHAKAPLEAAANGSAPTTATLSATIGDELRVLTALHQVGADLGDPIDVSRSGGDVLVTGVGIAPRRQQEIQDALSTQPHVVVRFSESAPASVPPGRSATDTSHTGADIRQLQARVAEQIGGRANFEQLATQVLDMSEPMMSRAFALRRLSERFPTDVEAQLAAPDRQLLKRLQQEHIAALREQTADLDRVLRPVLAAVTGAGGRASDGAPSSSAWQPATEELFQSARRVEKLLAVMFGAAPGESASEQLPTQLLASLAQLRAKVEGYDRLVTKTER